MGSDEDWFLPKRFGYGAGLPIAWQGWALLGGYVAILAVVLATLPPRHLAIAVGIILAATIVLLAVSAQHTRGGWRWRWGGD